MSREEFDEFLSSEFSVNEDGLKAAVASLRKDGSPFVVPMGFWYDKTFFYVSLSPTRGGTYRMRRDPRVSISVFRHPSPAKMVTFTGLAKEIRDENNEISRKIYHRYPRPDSYTADFEENWLAAGKVVFQVEILDWSGLDLAKVEGDLARHAQTPADKKFIARGANL